MVNPLVSKELDNYGYKFKMSFVLPVALQIHFFSKNKNVIGHMQKANRTPLIKAYSCCIFCVHWRHIFYLWNDDVCSG